MTFRYALNIAIGLSVACATSPSFAASPAPDTKAGRRPAAAPIGTPPAPSEQLFVPIAPCRAFDTSQTTPIPANTARFFYVAGSANFAAQGGNANGCGVPDGATGIAIDLTTSNSGGTGKITAITYGQPAQTPTTTVSFNSSANFTSAVALGVGSSRIVLRANFASTNVTGDITGYFIPQMQARIAADASVSFGTSRVLSSVQSSSGPGTYSVTFDRDVSACSVTAMAEEALIVTDALPVGGATVFVRTFALDGTTAPHAFSVTVHC